MRQNSNTLKGFSHEPPSGNTLHLFPSLFAFSTVYFFDFLRMQLAAQTAFNQPTVCRNENLHLNFFGCKLAMR